MANKTIHELTDLGSSLANDYELAIYNTTQGANTTGKGTILNLLGTSITGLNTTASTLPGAINELNGDIGDINTLIGDTSMGTTATTITGAIAEHEQDISSLNSKTSLSQWAQIVSGVEYASEGHHVFIRLNISASLSTTFTTIATLPSGKRPIFNQYFRVTGSNGSGDVTVLVSTNGSIQAKVDTGTGSAVNGFICIA